MGQTQSQQAPKPESSNTGKPQVSQETTPSTLEPGTQADIEPTPSEAAPTNPPPRPESQHEDIVPVQVSQSAEPLLVDSGPQDPELFDEEDSYFSQPPQHSISQGKSAFVDRTPQLNVINNIHPPALIGLLSEANASSEGSEQLLFPIELSDLPPGPTTYLTPQQLAERPPELLGFLSPDETTTLLTRRPPQLRIL